MIGFGQGQDRAERLLTLSCVLQVGRPLSLLDLRERFGLYAGGSEDASRRKFERDKADLRELGIHVESMTLRGEEVYRLPTRPPSIAISWTPEEALALAALAAAVGDEVTGGALAKTSFHTGDYPAESSAARIRLDLGVSPALLDAHAQRRRVSFTYRNAKGEVAERLFEPWALATRRSQSYVTGYDVVSDEGRVFRLDRIVGEVTDVGEAVHERPAEGLGLPLAPQVRATVHLRVPHARLADALAMGAEVVESDEATVEVRLTDIREESAIGWALRHLADVVSPDPISDAVDARRSRIADVHTGPPSLDPLDEPAAAPRTRRAGLSEERLARLLALPDWLAARPGVTVEEVATAFGCDLDEVKGELELLEWLEIPRLGFVGDLTIDDTNGQVEFRTHMNAPRADLTTVEAVHLLSLVTAAQALLPSATSSVLESVEKRLRDVLPDGIDAWHLNDLANPAVATLRDVVGTDVVVRFRYHGRRDAEATERRARPLQFQLTGGALYLSGFDVDRGGVRSFRLERMSDVTVEGASDDDGQDATPIEPDYVAVDDEVRVELRLSSQATWILTLVDATTCRDLGDGAVHAVVHTDVPDWLLSHVRAAGGEAEVLHPDALRQALAAR